MPSQLDLTTAIAVAGLLVGLFSVVLATVSLILTLRRDRATERVSVLVIVGIEPARERGDPPKLHVDFSNPERRTVSVMRAGLSVTKDAASRSAFKGWDHVVVSKGHVSPFNDGLKLEPGDPARPVRANLYRVRAACFPDVARWVWCEDSIGGIHWGAIPKSAQTTISATKRHRRMRVSGQDVSVEIEDADPLDPSELDNDANDDWSVGMVWA